MNRSTFLEEHAVELLQHGFTNDIDIKELARRLNSGEFTLTNSENRSAVKIDLDPFKEGRGSPDYLHVSPGGVKELTLTERQAKATRRRTEEVTASTGLTQTKDPDTKSPQLKTHTHMTPKAGSNKPHLNIPPLNLRKHLSD